MVDRVKPPGWFWIVAGLLVLWGLAACGSYAMHMGYNPDDPANPAYDRQLYKSIPGWVNVVYAVAVGTVLAGALALAIKAKEAAFLFAISLIAVMVQFGWTLGATDLIAVKGVGVAAGPPLVIALTGAFALWFARLSRRRGWIG